MMDFNDAPEQTEYSLIPSGTIAQVQLNLRQCAMLDDPYVTPARFGDSQYLDCEFTVLEGDYKDRKIFDAIGVAGSKEFVDIGKSKIRALLEAARGFKPKDESELARKARQIKSYAELDGLRVLVKIGIRKDPTGKYQDRNKLSRIFTPNDPQYLGINPKTSDDGSKDFGDNSLNDEIPF